MRDLWLAMTAGTLTWTNVGAAVALVLSIASFWNAYFTRGRIVLARPLGVTLRQAPQMSVRQSAPMGWTQLWRMYLVFCNTGAQHRLVYNVRLIVQDGERSIPLPIAQWLKTVKPQADESDLTAAGGDFAGSFAIPPRATFERASMFKARPTEEPWLLQHGVYQCALEALVDRRWRRPGWKKLTTFDVVLTAQAYAGLAGQGWVNLQAEPHPFTE